MHFQDVWLLPSQASFSTIFLKKYGGCEGLWTTTCLRTVVEGNQGHAPSKIVLAPTKPLFVSVKFHVNHMTITKLK